MKEKCSACFFAGSPMCLHGGHKRPRTMTVEINPTPTQAAILEALRAEEPAPKGRAAIQRRREVLDMVMSWDEPPRRTVTKALGGKRRARSLVQFWEEKALEL